MREAVSLTASEALTLKVIDIIATDVNDLLRQADGRKVVMDSGTVQLKTAGLATVNIMPTWQNKVLAVASAVVLCQQLVENTRQLIQKPCGDRKKSLSDLPLPLQERSALLYPYLHRQPKSRLSYLPNLLRTHRSRRWRELVRNLKVLPSHGEVAV